MTSRSEMVTLFLNSEHARDLFLFIYWYRELFGTIFNQPLINLKVRNMVEELKEAKDDLTE